MTLRRLIAFLLAMALIATAQTVPPEVLLLAHIKAHVREELSHTPNYTCLETISRFHKQPDNRSRVAAKLKPLDTVRLEIVYSNFKEWYGAPGDRLFGSDNPVGFIGSGLIGTGAFAITLSNLVEGATMTYRGEELLAGQTAVRYDFHLPRLLKGLSISMPGGTGTVGESGSLWVNPKSLDVIRVAQHVDEIPPSLPLEESSMTVSYARTRIGDNDVMLAQQADMQLLDTASVEDFARLDFTHCRAFSAQSSIRFDEEPREPAAEPIGQHLEMPVREASARAVPAFLPVTVRLNSKITQEDAVGTLIAGTVENDLVSKGKVVVAKGSTIRGRIRRLEQYQGSGEAGFIVGLEFLEVEGDGESLRFYADFLRMDKNPGLRPSRKERVLVRDGRGGVQPQEVAITLADLPGVASFFASGTTFTIPSGFRLYWRTRGLLH